MRITSRKWEIALNFHHVISHVDAKYLFPEKKNPTKTQHETF